MGRTDANPKVLDRPECPSPLVCVRVLDEEGTYVAAELVDVKPTTQTAQIVLGMQVESTDDRTSWPPATKVLP
jgi:hypothetical protein